MSTVADKLAKKSSSKTSAKQVRLRLVYVDFWSAVKLSFLAAVALAIVTIVVFFLVGAVLLTRVNVPEGQRIAREREAEVSPRLTESGGGPT